MIGRILAARQRKGMAPLPWRLEWRPVCGSTETWLDRRLAGAGCPCPLALLAGRQRFARGQRGRRWESPAGGVWMSAVLPWLEPPGAAASPALAAAAGLAAELEALGLEVELKWPNDLLVDGRKLAGLLPRLRWRGGGVQQARLGIGLNGRNRVPPGGISVAEALGRRSAASEPAALAARVLAALEWATAHSGEPETVRAAAERRLRRPPGGLEWQGVRWHVLGLEADGGLVLALGDRRTTLRRRF